jgi:hypothetical protein
LEDPAAVLDPLVVGRRSQNSDDGTPLQDKVETWRAQTETDAQAIVDDPDEFHLFQEHLRSQLYMTNASVYHNLYQLLRVHRNEMEWRNKRSSRNSFLSLPKNSIYESEFRGENDALTAANTISAANLEGKPSSPRSVISVVSRDGATLFLKPPSASLDEAQIGSVPTIFVHEGDEETKESLDSLPAPF